LPDYRDFNEDRIEGPWLFYQPYEQREESAIHHDSTDTAKTDRYFLNSGLGQERRVQKFEMLHYSTQLDVMSARLAPGRHHQLLKIKCKLTYYP